MTLYRPLSALTPSETGNADGAVTTGFEFTVPTGPAWLTEIRWYQPNSGTTDTSGTRKGALWSTVDGYTGTLLASATSAAPAGTGWQTLTLATPYQLATSTVYRIGVFHPAGGYGATANFFTTGAGASGLNSGPIHVSSNAEALGGNSQGSFFSASDIAYPRDSFNAGQYWVDGTFSDTDPGSGGGGGSWTWAYSARQG